MIPYSLCLSVGYRANIARQLGVPNVSFHNYEGMLESADIKIANSGLHLFLLDNLMGDLEKRSVKKFKIEIAQWIASKHLRFVRDKAAKEAEELCASGKCAASQPLLQKAIYLGHLPSRALMAHMLLDGREGVVKDEGRGFELAEEGAHLGCHHCQGVLARCYLLGSGCEKDEERSLELARESSGRGSRYGQFTLGGLHECGECGDEDEAQEYAQAVVFYGLAAAQGLDGAQCQLGIMYHSGHGVTQDFAEALRWHQLAAAQGLPQALYCVALCHKRGLGVDADVAEAIRWYKLAQAAGCLSAEYALLRLYALE